MFDPRIELANNRVEQLDLFISKNDKYESWRQGNFGLKARETPQSYGNPWSLNGEEVDLRPPNTKDESGIHSPPLWTTSPPMSPVHPRHQPTNNRFLSPDLRKEAIVRGQRELMEMVKNMPETYYELSLKDIVEQPRGENQEECLLKEQNFDLDRDFDSQVVANQRASDRRQGSKNNEKKATMGRNESMETNGLFLKMVFPVSFKSKKKKSMMMSSNKTNNNSSASAKVSPKPEISNRTNSASVDKDWWKKRFSVSSDQSGSSSSSGNSGSTGSRGSSGSSSSYRSRSNSSSRNRKYTGLITTCLPCFHSTKTKST